MLLLLASLESWIMAAPFAFTLGFFLGLAAASRYRIVRAKAPSMNGKDSSNEQRC